MKYLLLAFFAMPILAASDCNTNNVPACVKRIIADAKKNSPADAPLQIDEYLYRNERVFLFTAPCCDQYNTLYDMKCNPVCAPTGGITGKGDGKCPDFIAEAKLVRTLWKKEN
jgi:hypothetical protein